MDNYKGIGNFLIARDDQRTDLFLPIYIDFRFHVSPSRSTFFTYANFGYSIYLTGKENQNFSSSSSSYYSSTHDVPTNGGTFFCSGIGLKIFATKRIGVGADFGFKFQSYEAKEYTYRYNIIIIQEPTVINCIQQQLLRRFQYHL